MQTRLVQALVASLTLSASGVAFAAPSITLHSSNVGITSLNTVIDEVNKTIVINETWTAAGPGVLLFEGFNVDGWSVTKNVTNQTGINWDRLANELLDAVGGGDDGNDPLPYPAFVPTGFTTSNHSDGLTFIDPRDADPWMDIFIDEVTDARDFNDYFDGVLASGATGTIRTGLNVLINGNDFLWFQRFNTCSTQDCGNGGPGDPLPEPAMLGLLGIGLLGFAATRRRRG